MQQTLSYSSSPSPTLISTIAQPIRSPTDTDTAAATPAIISVDFSYDPSRIMSPSAQSNVSYKRSSEIVSETLYMEKTSASNQPYSSLFGDPVPPPQPEDYFGTAAFETIRAGSMDMPSSEEDTLVAAVALNTLMGHHEGGRRLFSNVPYSRAQAQSIPRLQPPDIQILPNSSGGSSSEQLDSPNFMLLAPQDIVNKPDVYECEYEQAAQAPDNTFDELESQTEHRPISGSYASSGLDWYRPTAQHFAEFSRIPKLRPSSKMVMSMKHEEMPLSPLATMLQDSNGSSSGGEEQLLNNQGQQMRECSPMTSTTPTMDRNLILSPKQYLQQQQQELLLHERQLLETMRAYGLETPRTPSVHHSQPPPAESSIDISPTEEQPQSQTLSPVVFKDSVSTGGEYRVGDTRLHKKSSFTILSLRSPKTSLSHSPSATPVAPRRTRVPAARHPSLQSTTTSSNTAQPQVRPRRKSLTASRLPQLPTSAHTPNSQLAIDDSPRPSVQFNMSGRYSPSKLAMPTKGILQQRDSLTSSVDTYTPRVQRRGSMNMGSSPFGQRIKSLEALPLITDPYRSGIPRLHRSSMELDKEPSIIPPGTLPRPLKPNPNPTRKQRGLLGVINKADDFPRNPPSSNWLSLDDLTIGTHLAKSAFDPMRIQARRRSSSTSPERRSSTQTASDRRSSNLSSITTSDFSFRRPSTLSTLPTTAQRRNSVYQPPRKEKSPRRQPFASKDLKRAKIAKPSTLSPIIGTPNKDSGKDSPLHGDAYEAAHRDTPSELSMRRDSMSRIPVRSRQDSYPNSRSNSPLKDFANLSSLSGRNSQASNSRSPSQATIRSSIDNQGATHVDSRLTPTRFNGSRPVSRGPPSRPSSRIAQTKDTSQANSRGNSRANSRADSQVNSRANSRADSQANSRANSRLSVRSSLRATSISPATSFRNDRQADTTPNRRKSISTSPKRQTIKGMAARRMSLSPAAKQAKPSPRRESNKTPSSSQRRNSRSRIPTSTSVSRNASKSSSPSKKQADKPSDKSGASKGKKPAQVLSKSSPKAKSSKAESAKKKTSSISKPELGVKRNGGKVLAKSTPKNQATKPKTPAKPQKQEPGQNSGKTEKPATKTNGASGLPKPLARTGSQLNNKKPNESPSTKSKQKESPEKVEATAATAAAKDIAADSMKPLAMHVGNAVNAAADALPAVRSEVNATPAKSSAVKRQGSNTSTLIRMSSRLSMISNKKRGDSAQNRKVATVPELTTEVEASNSQADPLAGSDSLGPTATSSDALEATQKSSAAATTEAHKTVNEHLIDHKTHENESGLAPVTGASPTPSGVTMLAKSHDAAPRLDTADGSNAQRSSPSETQKSPLPPTQPIEASISVLNAIDADAASAQTTAHGVSAKPEADCDKSNLQEERAVNFEHATSAAGHGDDFPVDDKRLSPDGQGGSTAGSGGIAKTSSQEFLKEDVAKGGCCRCCTTLCMRFRRSRCMRCCGMRKERLHDATEEQPVLSSARSSASTTTTQLEIIDESKHAKKSRCWPTSNCCKSCRKKPKPTASSEEKETKMSVEPMHQSTSMRPKQQHHQQQQQQSKCGLCLRKVFCCRSVNKVDPVTGDETELRKCCFCIPCRRQRAAAAEPKVAWRDQDPELGIAATDAAVLEGSSVAPSTATVAEDVTKMSCCRRFWLMLLCCRKKPRRGSDARRQSIKAPPASEVSPD
ncbi:protein stum isoform X2 [Drosophila montana]|uniref:protein stum isoform X2 n=1 Tax=Drosophila montana TaxID=40370 RepID=UPI00313C2891